jgi:hypothetical protein
MLIQAGRSWRPRPPDATPTAVELKGCLLRERLAPEVVGQSAIRHVTGDEVDDGFEVSFGSVALGLALGGLDIAVDRLQDAIGKAGGDRSEEAMRRR